MPRPQFSLKTMLWMMAVVGVWCVVCRGVLYAAPTRPPILRALAVAALLLATAGIGFLGYAARMNIGQDWQRGAVQFAWAMFGVGLMLCAACLVFAVSWIWWAANAG
ncbi:MAG TPA: hypothetical protein VG826_03245 [Pirellulales bacterium]|nr:hypothetical protein [Pirellulales bacterium]